jgi:hypothetical protein
MGGSWPNPEPPRELARLARLSAVSPPLPARSSFQSSFQTERTGADRRAPDPSKIGPPGPT